MICECGHDEDQHGPEGGYRLCAYCLCNDFQEVTPDIGLNLEAAIKRLETVLKEVRRREMVKMGKQETAPRPR